MHGSELYLTYNWASCIHTYCITYNNIVHTKVNVQHECLSSLHNYFLSILDSSMNIHCCINYHGPNVLRKFLHIESMALHIEHDKHKFVQVYS